MLRIFDPRWGRHDKLFFLSLLPSFAILVAIVGLTFATFLGKAWPILSREGVSFFVSSRWWPDDDPSKCFYGILPALIGTLLTSGLAVGISFPLTLAMVVACNEILPRSVGNALSTLVLVASSLPTVIYGLWGIEVVVPMVKELARYLGIETTGFSILAASIVLATMMIPYMFAIVNELYRSIPATYREAVYSIGARTWQASRILLSMTRLGLVAAVLLALGRATSETIVTTMLIGNVPSLTLNIFSPGVTIASLIATQFGESYLYPYMENALYASALVLFLMGFSLSGIGMYLVIKWRRWVHG